MRSGVSNKQAMYIGGCAHSLAVQVTDTDKRCEDAIVRFIRESYPDHAIIGEEDSAASGASPTLTDQPTWIIDPLDGTTNFVHKFPFVCVCIGVAVQRQVRLVPARLLERGA